MKKLVIALVFGLMISSLALVSADTLIAGKIYNYDFSETVAGATVVITCNGNDQTKTSLGDGSYSVIYNEIGLNSCDNGDFLSVYASHPSYGIGEVEGTINDDAVFTLDVGIVNVPLVPEFGVLVGVLTIFSAVGVFFLVRRE